MTEPTSMRVLSAEAVSLSTSNAQSTAVGSTSAKDWEPEVVRLVSDVDCWVAFGDDPTAADDGTNDSVFLPASVVEYFDITAGYKVAGIVASGTGTLSVAWMR